MKIQGASDFKELSAKFPRLIDKLLFWATKRNQGFTSNQFNHFDTYVRQQVEQYASDLLFVDTASQLKTSTDYWEAKLSSQERSGIGALFKEVIPWLKDRSPLDDGGYNHNLEMIWLTKSDWYKHADGEYITIKEQELDSVGTAIITRNAYDASILNADSMMIVDVDIESEGYDGDTAIALTEKAALAVLKAHTEDGEDSFRVYRTAAGLRYICTSGLWDATGYKSDRVMKGLFADHRYRKLCRFQETYRARLTPKPWRATEFFNEDMPIGGDWTEYYRVCELIGVYGDDKIIDNLKPIIEYHDHATGADKPSSEASKLILA